MARAAVDGEKLWPAPDEWPPVDAPPAVWATFYRDRLDQVPLPTPGPGDLDKIASRAYDDAFTAYREDHGGEPDEETAALLWELCRNDPELLARAKGVCGFVKASEYVRPAQVTDALIKRWWGTRDGRERGIALQVACEASRWPLVLVEVDRHGDDASRWGDVDGPWGRGGLLVGPRSVTPGGGLHTLVLAAGGERSSGGRTALAVGVEVKARGAPPVRVPSGSSAPGRRWERHDEPRPGPDDLRRARLPPGREPGDDPDENWATGAGEFGSGRATAAVRTEAADGDRNYAVPLIVGMLGRPRACPPDFVRACLELWAEDLAGPSEGRVDGPAARLERGRWEHALTRGPRDADFAAEVVACWVRVRDRSKRPWSEGKAETVARSLWKTVDRREQGEAGAEDLGVGPPVASRAFGQAPAWRLTARETATREDRIMDGPTVTASGGGDDDGGPLRERWRGGIDPRTFSCSLADYYPRARLEKDLRRAPVPLGRVFPVVDFVTGEYAQADGPAHGWGDPLSDALGGLSPADFRMVGAAGAKAGKTWFTLWALYGLALATAARVLGVPAYAKAPVVALVLVSEMPKRGELYWRLAGAHLGFDVACLSWGTEAARAPGVRASAQAVGWSPEEVVVHARGLEARHSDERLPFGLAYRRLLTVVEVGKLPPARGRGAAAIDHQSGPVLVDHVADVMELRRREVAAMTSVPEDEVLVVGLVDPGQRFVGEGRDARAAIDALFGAAARVLCGEVGAAVVGTSDTTKHAARNTNLDAFLGGDGQALAADIFAGSQAIMHNADTVAICAAPPKAGELRTTQWARVLQGRTGAPGEAFPFDWDMHLGRFTARPPEPLRASPDKPGLPSGGRPGSAPGPAVGRPLPARARPQGAGRWDD